MKQGAAAHLNPPIKNMGIKGIRRAAKELLKWPAVFDDRTLRMNLFNLYIFIEIGGTGGGCFRYMYARFLNEAAGVTGDKQFLKIAEMLQESGTLFSDVGNQFSTAETVADIDERICSASEKLENIAEIELEAFKRLTEIVSQS